MEYAKSVPALSRLTFCQSVCQTPAAGLKFEQAAGEVEVNGQGVGVD